MVIWVAYDRTTKGGGVGVRHCDRSPTSCRLVAASSARVKRRSTLIATIGVAAALDPQPPTQLDRDEVGRAEPARPRANGYRPGGSRGRPCSRPVSATASSHGDARVASCSRHALAAVPSASTASANSDAPAGRCASTASIACAQRLAQLPTASARRENVRSQPRTVAGGRPSRAAIVRCPVPGARRPALSPAAPRRSPRQRRAGAPPTTLAAARASSRTRGSTPAAASPTASPRASGPRARARSPSAPASRRSPGSTAARRPDRPPRCRDRGSSPTRSHTAYADAPDSLLRQITTVKGAIRVGTTIRPTPRPAQRHRT